VLWIVPFQVSSKPVVSYSSVSSSGVPLKCIDDPNFKRMTKIANSTLRIGMKKRESNYVRKKLKE
jgi:hypothetical protein